MQEPTRTGFRDPEITYGFPRFGNPWEPIKGPFEFYPPPARQTITGGKVIFRDINSQEGSP